MRFYKYPVLVLVWIVAILSACTGGITNDSGLFTGFDDKNKPMTLTGIVWKLKQFDATNHLDSFVIDDLNLYTLELLPNGQYRVRADCNRMHGGYSLDGNSLRLGPGAATRAECGPASHYADYLRRLAEVERYEAIDHQQLKLLTNTGVLVFINDGMETDNRARN